MLKNFRFARYRFSYTVLESLRLPPYKGNVFRSRFGYTLRDITCIGDADACESACQFREQCVYSRCFEIPVPDDCPFLSGESFAPHPFVLEPPRSGKLEYAPGDRLVCNLILIGDAIDLLPWMVFAFDQMGERRIGIGGERGRCVLDRVESLAVEDNGLSDTIYTGSSQLLTGKGLVLGLADVVRTIPDTVGRVEFDFLTPTSIEVAGRWMSDLRFEHLIGDLLRRIGLLSYFHCGEDLDVDIPSLRKAASVVTHESHLRWFRSDRRSYGGEVSVPAGGFVGRIRYRGNLMLFLPFLFLGAYLHIGHDAAFGYGQYRMRCVSG